MRLGDPFRVATITVRDRIIFSSAKRADAPCAWAWARNCLALPRRRHEGHTTPRNHDPTEDPQCGPWPPYLYYMYMISLGKRGQGAWKSMLAGSCVPSTVKQPSVHVYAGLRNTNRAPSRPSPPGKPGAQGAGGGNKLEWQIGGGPERGARDVCGQASCSSEQPAKGFG